MARTLLLLTVLLFIVGAMLSRLRARGFSVKMSVKMAAFAAGFVVSVKMVLGGYLALQGDVEPALVRVLGFWGALGLALFFGVATVSLWRRGSATRSVSR